MGQRNEVEVSMILFHEVRTASNSWERNEQRWPLGSLPAVDLKKNSHNLKIESYVIFGGNF